PRRCCLMPDRRPDRGGAAADGAAACHHRFRRHRHRRSRQPVRSGARRIPRWRCYDPAAGVPAPPPARPSRGPCLHRRGARSSLPPAGLDPGARLEGEDLMSGPAGRHEQGGAAEILRRLWPLVALAAIIAVVAVAASFAPAVLQRRTTQGLINLIAVVGLYVFVGNSGVLSFGNIAFMPMGAYVSAPLPTNPCAQPFFLPHFP